MKASKETIFALATQRGKSGIAVFRVSGKSSHTIIKSISSKKKFKTNFATLNDLLDGKSVIDQTLTTFFKSPKSYTGEDMVEISCHGSISVINKITKTLLKKQIRLAEPGEFTKRALMNDKLSVLEAETINDLVNAETENQRKIAIGNLSGNLDKLVNEISNKQKKLLADIEAIIDFADEDLPKEIYKNIIEQNKNIYKQIENIIERSNLSRQIQNGFKLTIIGNINYLDRIFLSKNENVEILGPKKNLKKFIRDAYCGLANLSIATGVQSKVLTYMSNGLPVLCHSKVAVNFGNNVLSYRQDKDLIQKLILLKSKKKLSQKYSKMSIQFSKKFVWKKISLKYLELLNF